MEDTYVHVSAWATAQSDPGALAKGFPHEEATSL